MRLVLLVAVLALVLLVSGCVSEPAPVSQPPAPSPPVAEPPAPAPAPVPEPAPPASEVKEFTVTAKSFEFIPSEFTVKQGDTVRFKVTSIDVTHGLFVSGYNKNVQLVPGEEAVLEFVADKAGTFSMSCSVFCGSGHGQMRATLVVE